MRAKLRRWLIFSVFLALLPFGFNALLALALGPSLRASYLFGGGELILLAVGLCTAGLGDALAVPHRREAARDVLIAFCAVFLALSAFLFALVAVGNASNDPVDDSVLLSLVMYVCATITGGFCTALSEE